MTADDQLTAFLARPGQDLADHLEGVNTASQALVQDAGTTPDGDDWRAVMETVAWTHDIGKLTEYFQTYIRAGERTAAPAVELTYHGFFGALVSAVVLAKRGFSPQTAAAGFYAVAKHHSVLQNIPTDISQYHQNKSAVDGRYETADKQRASIDATAATAANTVLQRASDDAYTWEEFTDGGVTQARKTIANLDAGSFDATFYGCVLRVWSTLVAADKFDASGLTAASAAGSPVSEPSQLAVEQLTDRVAELSQTELPDGSQAASYLETPTKDLPTLEASQSQRLAALRTAANGRATTTLREQYATGERVFELTLPTGFGKTYSGLRAALTLANERDGRVVYALPYTSIIDQVDADIQDVFGVTPQEPVYTKHHHLADTRTVPQETDGFSDDWSSGRETLHAEAWRSRLVLTTFTQLFESVAGPGNVQSTKLPALQNSVILVDEPQAVSLDWWALMGRLTRYLVDEYDATMLFITATQPRILEQLTDAPTPTPLTDLHTDCAELIRESPRVTFELHDSLTGHLDGEPTQPLSLKQAGDEIATTVADGTNTLAVVNTVGSAVALSERISTTHWVNLAAELLDYYRDASEPFSATEYLARLDQAQPDADGLVATLTTRLRPVDRSVLLDALSQIVDPETSTPFDGLPTVTVSTQLIEAGVDISFDQLYRDYAALPAIAQAAGRCNRRFGGPPASVTVWRLDSPPADDYIPSQLIYGDRSLLRPTRTALSKLRTDNETTCLPEAAVITDGVAWYYEALHEQRRTDEREDTLLSAFDTAQGEKLRNASLVSTDYPTRDVLVLVSGEDEDRYDQYQELRDDGHWQEARDVFQQLKELLISVPVSNADDSDELTAVRLSTTDAVYDPVVGIQLADGQSDSEI